jgi:hypothetical protein
MASISHYAQASPCPELILNPANFRTIPVIIQPHSALLAQYIGSYFSYGINSIHDPLYLHYISLYVVWHLLCP